MVVVIVDEVSFEVLSTKYARWHITHCNKRFNLNPIALRKAKIVYNFGLSECNGVNEKPPYILRW